MNALDAFAQASDLAGTFVFAISGAMAAASRRLDFFGILVLSFVAGNVGGMTRDLLIGAVPPAALTHERYLLVSTLAGIIVFFWRAGVSKLRDPVLLFDAAGLSIFAVVGAHKAIQFGLSPVMAALMGMLTGIGGGMARDILIADIPEVLRSDLYALAALLGASAVVVGEMIDLSYAVSALVGAALCFGLRMMAIRRGWRLPTARLSARRRAESAASDDERTH